MKYLAILGSFLLSAITGQKEVPEPVPFKEQVIKVLRTHILEEAAWAMKQQPVTVTAYSSPRSAGGRHDYFSEADYFWPDPKNPNGPYIQRDGMSNPENFTGHRHALIR